MLITKAARHESSVARRHEMFNHSEANGAQCLFCDPADFVIEVFVIMNIQATRVNLDIAHDPRTKENGKTIIRIEFGMFDPFTVRESHSAWGLGVRDEGFEAGVEARADVFPSEGAIT